MHFTWSWSQVTDNKSLSTSKLAQCLLGKPPFEYKQVMCGILHKISLVLVSCFVLVIRGAALYVQIEKREKSNSMNLHKLFFWLSSICANNTHLSDGDMKQDHQKNHLTGHNLKMKGHFVPLSYCRLLIPLREQRFYTMNPLLSIYFCILHLMGW